MEALTLPLVVVGLTQLIKAVAKYLKVPVSGATTIIVACVVGGLVAFVDLDSTLVQGIYSGIVAVGGVTALQKLGSVVSLGEPVDEEK